MILSLPPFKYINPFYKSVVCPFHLFMMFASIDFQGHAGKAKRQKLFTGQLIAQALPSVPDLSNFSFSHSFIMLLIYYAALHRLAAGQL